MWVSVRPWLSTLSIWEVSISSSNSNIKNKEKSLIEWSNFPFRLWFILPWIVYLRKSSFFKHVLVKWEVKDSCTIDVCFDAFLCPLHFVFMEITWKVFRIFMFFMCFKVCIHWISWTKMKSATNSITSTNGTFWCISSWLDQINFTRCWPLTISILFWKKPNSWPNPITLWKLCFDLNRSILESKRFSSSDPGTLDWIQYISTCSCISRTAIECIRSTMISWGSSPKI